MDTDRKLVFLILRDMERKAAYSNLALNSRLKEGVARSESFVRELVYGILRNQLLLDWNIERFLKKSGLRTAEKLLLRMGFYQISCMDSVPQYAAVNESVELAAVFAKGRQGFINGVLRNFVREGGVLLLPDEAATGEERFLSVKYSCHESIVALWLAAYGRERTEEMLAESLSPAPLSARVNTLKTSREELLKRLQNKAFSAREGRLAFSLSLEGSGVLGSEEFSEGLFQVQSEASQLAVEVLAPKPGDFVIDLCAAPGGKCCTAAMLMENRGSIKAFDCHEQRTGLITKLAERLGIGIISVETADAALFNEELRNSADCVICDVPCSGLGVMRRKPELKLKALSSDPENLIKTQNQILNNGALYVKLKGGKLLYSTCTVNPAENSQVVRAFLEEHSVFAVEYERQIFPCGDSDGFYICLLRRQDD